MDEKKIAHLGFIESAIERMANNSAAIKGWSMGIAAALLGIGIINGENVNDSGRWVLLGCACLITIVMWCLDAFYLYQEKLYRNLYSFVRNAKEDDIDFSMDARYKKILELNGGDKKKVASYFPVLKNRTIWPFYLAQIVVYFLFFALPIIMEFTAKTTVGS